MTWSRGAAPSDLDATAVAALIRVGRLSAEALMQDCLDRIIESEQDVRAFVSLDAEGALAAARAMDAGRGPRGPLAGVPFAVKDIIDVAGMETRFGSDLPIGQVASRDAAAVALLRHAGAIPIGKAETVEFAATGRIPPTRNPLDLTRSPGGSSSGSAAAVAACMVPLALGTQTGGSLVRPASYTGLYAMKPSYGVISTAGVHPYAPSLDCVGWHARSLADLQLLADIFHLPSRRGHDRPRARLSIAICRTPQWQEVEEDVRLAFDAVIERLGRRDFRLEEIVLPHPFDELVAAQLSIMRGEGRASFLNWYEAWGSRLHPKLREIYEGEIFVAPETLTAAQNLVARCRAALPAIMEGFDAIIAPAATSEAPLLAAGTGSPVMNRMWSALLCPIIAIPAAHGRNGLPVGCQLVGLPHRDRDLVSIAASLDGLIAPKKIELKK